MALINCCECNHRISDKANACPHCGAPTRKPDTEEATVKEKMARHPLVRDGVGGVFLVNERVFNDELEANEFAAEYTRSMEKNYSLPAIGPKYHTKKNTTFMDLLIWSVLILGGIWGISKCTSQDTEPQEKAGVINTLGLPTTTHDEALTMCQFVLKKLSRDPERADVPYVRGIETASEIHFYWSGDTKMMRMRNGLGLEVATPGSCIVSRQERKITRVVFDNRVVE